MDKLKQFYTSKSWRGLSYSLKISRRGKCDAAGSQLLEKSDWIKLIGHHKIELTECEHIRSKHIAEPGQCRDCLH